MAVKFGQDDVVRLDVPMDDPLGMRFLKRTAHVDADVKSPLQLQAPAIPERIAQQLARGYFHGEVQVAFPGQTKVVDHGRVAALQYAGRLGLQHKPFDPALVLDECLVQNLQRYFPVNRHLARAVDRAHPTFAKQVQDLVLAVEHSAHKALVRVEHFDQGFAVIGALQLLSLEALKADRTVMCSFRTQPQLLSISDKVQLDAPILRTADFVHIIGNRPCLSIAGVLQPRLVHALSDQVVEHRQRAAL